MAMEYERRSSSFWEADCYLQEAQEVISRSLHELASITIKNEDDKQIKFSRRNRQSSSDLPSSAIYRKNSFPAVCLSQHDIVNFVQSFSSNDDQHADAEYYVSSRRKRFTRRQRRNLTGGIFGKRTSKSTSALNRVHRSESTSSSDNDSINEQRKRSIQLTTASKRGQSTASRRATTSTEAAFLSLRQNYVNSSLITRSTTEICCKSTSTRPSTSIEPTDIFYKFKGPTARKARRRTLRYKLNSFVNNNQFETKAGLDVHADNIQFEKDTLVRRSVSVRELNGTMIDFTNQDSVTRWTSQILAEIDSLPSSSFDLTGQSTRQLSPFIISATSGAITDSIINSTTTDADIVRPNELKYDSLKQNMQSPLRNNSNISFEMGVMNSTPSAQSHDNESQISLSTHHHHRTQKIASKSSSSHFIKFQKRNSYKKNIWHQSMEIPEVSCTAHIVLTARASNRRKQSVHAIVISAPKDTEKSEKLHFSSPKFSSNNCSSNLQNCAGVKNASSCNESSRLWRFWPRKKYSSFKKYLKLHQKNTQTTEIISDTKVSGFSKENSPIIMNGKNHLPQCNSGSKWKIKEIESNHGLPLSRTNLSLVLDIKPDQRFSQMPNSVHGQLSGYEAANDVKWRSNVDSAGSRTSDGHIGSNRTCFSMESIDLVKENGIDDRLKFLGETKRIQPVDETSSALNVWKRKAECRAQKLETFGDVVDGTTELNSTTTTPNSTTTTVQPVDKTATSATTTTVINRDLSGDVDGSGKSVHGIVASLIRAAEETRFQAPDKPKSLNLSRKKFQPKQPSTTATATITSEQQDTGTQTSPYSLSRSSSFDWINESSLEDQCSEELIITSTESPGTPGDPEYSSLNRTVESHTPDKEVQGMLRKSSETRGSLFDERKIQSSEDIDNSIAILLEYAGGLDMVSNRELHYPLTSENFTKVASDIRNNEPVLSREIPPDIFKNRMSSTNNQHGSLMQYL